MSAHRLTDNYEFWPATQVTPAACNISLKLQRAIFVREIQMPSNCGVRDGETRSDVRSATYELVDTAHVLCVAGLFSPLCRAGSFGVAQTSLMHTDALFLNARDVRAHPDVDVLREPVLRPRCWCAGEKTVEGARRNSASAIRLGRQA